VGDVTLSGGVISDLPYEALCIRQVIDIGRAAIDVSKRLHNYHGSFSI
jgi:hypothetical protein